MATTEDVFAGWCQQTISNLLGFPVGQEIVTYLVTLENERDTTEYLSSLLDVLDPNCQMFIAEFVQRTKLSRASQMYKKSDTENDVLFCGKSSKKLASAAGNSIPTSYAACAAPAEVPAEVASVGDTSAGEVFCSDSEYEGECNGDTGDADDDREPSTMLVDTTGAAFLDKLRTMDGEHVANSVSQTPKNPFKKKTVSYKPLFSKAKDGSQQAETIMLPGRHACECLAQKHRLINNCVECGRVVCAQEGAGPCIFCGHLVCTPEDQDMLQRDSKKSRKLHERLLSCKIDEPVEEQEDASLQRAVAHKNKLLEFDRTSASRTKVFDDEADYFATDSRWLTDKQRTALEKREQELRDKRFASRRDQKFTIDFAGRKVLESNEDKVVYDADDTVVQAVTTNKELQGDVKTYGFNMDTNLDPRVRLQPEFRGELFPRMDRPVKTNGTTSSSNKKSRKIQDTNLQEMADQGMCLSMHQPWASLLVAGIKKVEGRGWYTSHRGRLWIASTVKEPDPETIQHVQRQYSMLYPDETPDFPEHYPSACLLGCVYVVDCLTQEEYLANVDALDALESESDYLLMCEQATQLVLKVPMKGQHKIYKLEPHVHSAAKKSLIHAT